MSSDVTHSPSSEHGTELEQTTAADVFPNPGLPPHVHRFGDDDAKAARRSERQVASLFVLSMIATVLFVVFYFAVGDDDVITLPLIGPMKAMHFALGVSLAVSLLGIGFGAVHWAKTIMSDEEVVEERHELRSSDEARAGAVEVLSEGAEVSQINRRPLIKYTLGGALGLFAIPLGVQLVGGLGPLPGNDLSTTLWDTKLPNGKPRRLMRDPEGTAIRLSDVSMGSAFHVLPEGIEDTEHPLNQKVKASVLLVKLEESEIRSERQKEWGIGGVVAYSKICTHVGCPVGLYEQQTHHLLCPCHQSTFDMTNDCEVIFGPAKRPLPQLKIAVDDEGYLIAAQGFQQPVGPSFWERA
ncbi:menaquinol-cytochrome c reductase iron-sulfur subunit precursor [Branchiibius hedensis]|uniref:Cytochrome bc1 complex Rieske iron-sulfur subunit n=1 Tax=Branchiibius hedensis TaxID=672460 RepID=A0A2Y8ZMW0_9MICO|nr:Rieske 2Fe-2S domain-containing protein [Branchiibius hedensis]PWJ24824.1 menaquinol-cytochrome c reductase iron-sulfur subunit precursor [Branchiibius hedensis]SSA33640.1 menaquinol-cytochrome c reductase iron-sulfur subunit precursor [Branchiibius hedensis]